MSSPALSTAAIIPPLRDGDQLTRDEFERRYEAMPEVKKAELIEGVVYMPSPVRFEQHGEHQVHLLTWLGVYRAHTPGVRVGDNSTVRLDLTNEPQPDAVLLIDPAMGGQATFTEGYITGAPELVAEVAASSVSKDRNARFRAYQRNSIMEYVIWRIEDQAIDWYVLRDAQYVQLVADSDGILHSEHFPGLWLEPAALLAANLVRVLAVLQQGLATPEHTAFVTRLSALT